MYGAPTSPAQVHNFKAASDSDSLAVFLITI